MPPDDPNVPHPASHADYWRGVRQGRMMSRIERCVCTFDEAGDGPIDVCAAHREWMERAVAGEHARLRAALLEVEGFASQVHGLSLLAQAELDNGDMDGVQKTLVRIAEVASAKTNK